MVKLTELPIDTTPLATDEIVVTDKGDSNATKRIALSSVVNLLGHQFDTPESAWGTDLNNYTPTVPGHYTYYALGFTNLPTGESAGEVLVIALGTGNTSTVWEQIFISATGIYVRVRPVGQASFDSWVKLSNTQADWNQATTTDPAYIRNKPTIPSGTAFSRTTTTVSDLNAITNSNNTGIWAITRNPSNAPAGVTGDLMVREYRVSANEIYQFLVRLSNGQAYNRVKTTTWGTWAQGGSVYTLPDDVLGGSPTFSTATNTMSFPRENGGTAFTVDLSSLAGGGGATLATDQEFDTGTITTKAPNVAQTRGGIDSVRPVLSFWDGTTNPSVDVNTGTLATVTPGSSVLTPYDSTNNRITLSQGNGAANQVSVSWSNALIDWNNFAMAFDVVRPTKSDGVVFMAFFGCNPASLPTLPQSQVTTQGFALEMSRSGDNAHNLGPGGWTFGLVPYTGSTASNNGRIAIESFHNGARAGLNGTFNYVSLPADPFFTTDEINVVLVRAGKLIKAYAKPSSSAGDAVHYATWRLTSVQQNRVTGAAYGFYGGNNNAAAQNTYLKEVGVGNPDMEMVESGFRVGFPAASGGGGSTTFVGLTDTPGSITANQYVRGNAAGNALEFGALVIPPPSNIAKSSLATALQNEISQNTAKHGLYEFHANRVARWQGVSGNPGLFTTIAAGTTQFDGAQLFVSRTDLDGNNVGTALDAITSGTITMAGLTGTVTGNTANSSRNVISVSWTGNNAPIAAQGHVYTLFTGDANTSEYGVFTDGSTLENHGSQSAKLRIKDDGVTKSKIAPDAVGKSEIDFANEADLSAGRHIVMGAGEALTTVAPPSGGGASTFVGLTDTPANYTGQGGKYLAVNSGATAVEFVDAPSGGGSGGWQDLYTPSSPTSLNSTGVAITIGSTEYDFYEIDLTGAANFPLIDLILPGKTYNESSSSSKIRFDISGGGYLDVWKSSNTQITFASNVGKQIVKIRGLTAGGSSGGRTKTTLIAPVSIPNTNAGKLNHNISLASGQTLVGHDEFRVSFKYSHSISIAGHTFSATNRFSKIYDGDEFRAFTGGNQPLEVVYVLGAGTASVYFSIQRASDTQVTVSFLGSNTARSSATITEFGLVGINY